MVRLPVSGFTRSDFTVCWLLTFISPDKISKPENQSRHERTVKILQDLDKKIYNLRNAHILRHHNFQLFYHSPLPFNAILLSLLRTNTSSHHFENPYLIADDVICERSLNCRFFCQGVVRFLLFISWRLWFSGLDILSGKMNVSNQQTVKSELVKPLTSSLTVLRQRG